jgi:hypothetical protein
MLVKRTRGNQVSIPKRILEEAGVGEEDRYFDVICRGGLICFKPVTVEEKIPARAYEELLRWAARPHRGEKVFHSGKEAVAYIKSLVKKSG